MPYLVGRAYQLCWPLAYICHMIVNKCSTWVDWAGNVLQFSLMIHYNHSRWIRYLRSWNINIIELIHVVCLTHHFLHGILLRLLDAEGRRRPHKHLPLTVVRKVQTLQSAQEVTKLAQAADAQTTLAILTHQSGFTGTNKKHFISVETSFYSTF